MLSLFSRKVRKTRLLWQFVNDDCVPQLPDATETLVSRAGRLSIDSESCSPASSFERNSKTAFQQLSICSGWCEDVRAFQDGSGESLTWLARLTDRQL
jgi:hypothetical protein